MEGQYFIGGLASVFVGYSLKGLPWFIHLPLVVVAGMAGGAIWAAIAGFLKAKAGAHEVINTIMLNYIAYRLAEYLLQVGGPMARPGSRPISPEVEPSAYLPQFFPNNLSISLNAGLFLALAAVAVIYWLLYKTTLGFEIRAVGANPRAAAWMTWISRPARRAISCALLSNTRAVPPPTVPSPSKPIFTGCTIYLCSIVISLIENDQAVALWRSISRIPRIA